MWQSLAHPWITCLLAAGLVLGGCSGERTRASQPDSASSGSVPSKLVLAAEPDHDCAERYLTPPPLAAPDVAHVRATLWTHVQKGECRLADHDPDSIDFGIDGQWVHNKVDCNSQGGRWRATDTSFEPVLVMTTAMMCLEDPPRADLNDVREWGVDVAGDLYLLDDARHIVAITTPAHTQDAAARCADQLEEFVNALGACRRAVRRGWIHHSGYPGECWLESDTHPVTVTLLSRAQQRTRCLTTPRNMRPMFGPNLVRPEPGDHAIPQLAP